MTVEIPQGISDHVHELCQTHGLYEPGSRKLKSGWEGTIADIIKDSRFVVVGEGHELSDLSAVYVSSSSVMGRLFWGAVGPFTPSFWNSHYATEEEVKDIFRAVFREKAAAGGREVAEIPVSDEPRLTVTRRAAGPAGRRPPERKPFESRYQPTPAPAPTEFVEQPVAEEAARPPAAPPPVVKRPMGSPVAAGLAAAAQARRAAMKETPAAPRPPAAPPKVLKTTDEFIAALQAPNPKYDEIAKQLADKPAIQMMVQRQLGRGSDIVNKLNEALSKLKAGR